MNSPDNVKLVRMLQRTCWDKNIQIILKTSSANTWSYVYSEFFRLSINICKKFKVMSNKTRFGDFDDSKEGLLPYDFDKPQFEGWHAGPKFLWWFMEGPCKDLKPHITRVEYIMFAGYRNPDDDDEWKNKPKEEIEK